MGNNSIPKPFNLLRWFSIASLLAVLPVAGVTGFILSYVITQDTLLRDAAQTAQFIQNCVDIEGRHVGLEFPQDFSDYLDARIERTATPAAKQTIDEARQDVLEHLTSLPDVLLASLFTRDGTIIWSTNPQLVGTVSDDDDELEEAFKARVQVAKYHATNQGGRREQLFVTAPREFFIENYIPLQNARGEVVMVAEVYKEPRYLVGAIEHGQRLVWGATLLAGTLGYLALFGVIRRGSAILQEQQRQLMETDSLVLVGEMSTAIAHGLRNPLASIRSSAELAQGTEDVSVQKNARDIITQVDVLSKWIRELLLFSRPVTGEPEAVDLAVTLNSVVESFADHCAKVGIRVDWVRETAGRPRIEGNTSLVTQALHSVLANAVEAMPKGGELRVALEQPAGGKHCKVIVRDTGCGMSAAQLALAFKPFQTTKRNGLGVGLAMVKRVMERFGGSVHLASREGEGTEVRLEFRAV